MWGLITFGVGRFCAAVSGEVERSRSEVDLSGRVASLKDLGAFEVGRGSDAVVSSSEKKSSFESVIWYHNLM